MDTAKLAADAGSSTISSLSGLSAEQVNSLPETLQRKLEARREGIWREIEAFKEHKLREFDLFQNELWRSFSTEQQQQQQQQQEIASNQSNSYVTAQSPSIPSSLKGSNKRQRNGEKKKVMFRLAEEIPPVSPGADVVLDTSSQLVESDTTEADYVHLPAMMSIMSMDALDEPEEEMIENADAVVEDAPEVEFVTNRADDNSRPSVPSDDSADAETENLTTEDDNMKVPSISDDAAELGRSNAMLSSSAPTPSLRFDKRMQTKDFVTQFTPVPDASKFDTDSDDVFSLDESLHFSSHVDRPTFRRSGGKVSSFSDLYSDGGPFAPQPSSGYAFGQGDDLRVTITSAPSGWTGNSASFHTQAPSTNRTIPIPQQHVGGDSNVSSLDEDFDGAMTDGGISTFGSSLPIDIDRQPGVMHRLSEDSRLHDDSGEMGLRGGVLGEDEEYQLEKIKSFENPERLSFSRRIIWEQHVGSHLDG
ncbi:hypothetical protein V1525DRAFT_183871 [Lipomyces kononenkoae]|uniref:Uncharacterized protein n=1 Tax=Lipomyces kononenkoae TaxID=34357 RepID=A0ACC3SZN2_LIPKO